MYIYITYPDTYVYNYTHLLYTPTYTLTYVMTYMYTTHPIFLHGYQFLPLRSSNPERIPILYIRPNGEKCTFGIVSTEATYLQTTV